MEIFSIEKPFFYLTLTSTLLAYLKSKNMLSVLVNGNLTHFAIRNEQPNPFSDTEFLHRQPSLPPSIGLGRGLEFLRTYLKPKLLTHARF